MQKPFVNTSPLANIKILGLEVTIGFSVILGLLVALGTLPWYGVIGVSLVPFLLILPQSSLWYILFDDWNFNRMSFALHPLITTSTMALFFWFIYIMTKALRRRQFLRFSPNALSLLVIAFFTYMALSYWLHNGEFDTTIINNLFFYLFLFQAMATLKDIRHFFWVGVVAGAILTATGLMQWMIQGLGDSGLTGFGPISTRVQYGFYILIALPILMALLPQYPWCSRLMLGGLSLAFTLVILGSLARGVILVFIISSLLWLFWYRRERQIAIFVLILLFAFMFTPNIVWQRVGTLMHLPYLVDTPNQLNALLSGRIPLMEAAWRMFENSPLAGLGYRSYKLLWSEFAPSSYIGAATRSIHFSAHSTYLQIMAELGIIGIALYIGIFVSAFRNLKRTAHMCKNLNERFLQSANSAVAISLIIFALHGLLDNSGWHDRPFYFFLALTAILRDQAHQLAKSPRPEFKNLLPDFTSRKFLQNRFPYLGFKGSVKKNTKPKSFFNNK